MAGEEIAFGHVRFEMPLKMPSQTGDVEWAVECESRVQGGGRGDVNLSHL